MPMFDGKFILSTTIPGLASKIDNTGGSLTGTYEYYSTSMPPDYQSTNLFINSDSSETLHTASKYVEIDTNFYLNISNVSNKPFYGFNSSIEQYLYTDPLDPNNRISNLLTLNATSGFEFSFTSTDALGVSSAGLIKMGISECSITKDSLPYIATADSHITTKKYVDDAIAAAPGGSVSYNKAVWQSSGNTYNLGTTPKDRSVMIWLIGAGGVSGFLRERLSISDPVGNWDFRTSGTNVIFNTSSSFWGSGNTYYFYWAY
jgi:hypothetical protein